MPFRVKCPSGHNLMVPDSRAGKSVRCPKCEAEVQVPERMQPAEAPPVVVSSSPAPSAVPPLPADVLPPPLPVSEVQSLIPPPVINEPPIITLGVATSKEDGSVPPMAPPVAEPPVAVLPVIAPEFAPAVIKTVSASAQSLAVEETRTTVPASTEVAITPPQSVVPTNSPPTSTALPVPAEIASISSAPRTTWMARMADWGSSMPAAIETEISTRQWAAQLAMGLLIAAVFSCGPSAIDLVDYWKNPEEQFVARWALLLLALGCLQVAFAFYVWQLADWTSLWVLTILSLAVASGFAMMLGVILVAGQESQLVAALQLQDRLIGNKAQLWCLCMIAVYTVLAFFAGRACTFWHRREQLLEALR
ncbi:MAG: hypothetical protein ACO1RA_08285 [Planctomycetaceae bacterium]